VNRAVCEGSKRIFLAETSKGEFIVSLLFERCLKEFLILSSARGVPLERCFGNSAVYFDGLIHSVLDIGEEENGLLRNCYLLESASSSINM